MKSKQVSEFKETEIGDIPKDWDIVKLDDVCEVKSGKRLPVGKQLINSKTKHPYIRVRDLVNGTIDLNDLLYLDEQTFEQISRYTITKDDLYISIVGSIGLVGFVPDNISGANLTENCAKLTNFKKITKEWMYYFLNSSIGQEQIKKLIVGTTQGKLALFRIKDMSVFFPSLSEQKCIIDILGRLNDKINNLRNYNLVLEEIMQTIFESWFIDFADTAELKNSNIGLIPINWKVETVGSVLITKSGGTPSRNVDSYWKDGMVNWINSGKVRDFRIIDPVELITEEARDESTTTLIPKNTTVLAITGATLGQVSFMEIDSCVSQNVVAILGTNNIPSEFIYFWFKHNINLLMLSQTGGAQQHINKKIVDDSLLLIPEKQIMDKFNIIVKPIFKKILSNCFEIKNVTKIKDTLHTKLISGEIRV